VLVSFKRNKTANKKKGMRYDGKDGSGVSWSEEGKGKKMTKETRLIGPSEGRGWRETKSSKTVLFPEKTYTNTLAR